MTKDIPTSSSGLKRRTPAKTTGFKAIAKPRKMDLVRKKRLSGKTENFANPATLVFPTDPQGLTAGLKKEMLSVASRLGNDEKAIELFRETMKILMIHLEARCKQAEEFKGRSLKRRTLEDAPQELTESDENADDESSTEDQTDDTGASEGETEGKTEVAETTPAEPTPEAAPKAKTKKKAQPKTKAKTKK